MMKIISTGKEMIVSQSNGQQDFKQRIVDEQVEFEDADIVCIDCGKIFIWSGGEQLFFHDKGLKNPPKRCKFCKQAKNQRLSAIANAQAAGIKQRIEVAVHCARCDGYTTVPFYPSQGRPVYCRTCYLEMNPNVLGDSDNGNRV